MGATTLYHPISLQVIRGAAIYHGWQLGKIVQTHVYPEKTWAQYRCTIAAMPGYLKSQPNHELLASLRQCFMNDVKVHWLREGRSGTLYVDLVVDLRKATDALEDDLAWLTAKENSGS